MHIEQYMHDRVRNVGIVFKQCYLSIYLCAYIYIYIYISTRGLVMVIRVGITPIFLNDAIKSSPNASNTLKNQILLMVHRSRQGIEYLIVKIRRDSNVDACCNQKVIKYSTL